jgi:hypothetical protein
MKEIFLTRGQIAIVDDGDYDVVMEWQWHAKFSPHRRKWVAARTDHSQGKPLTILMHRQILRALPGQQTDHKNGNTLDNRRSNIRICDGSENCVNRAHRSGRKFRGVFPRENAFRTILRFKGKTYRETHRTAEDAAMAYNRLVLTHCRDFAILNEI